MVCARTYPRSGVGTAGHHYYCCPAANCDGLAPCSATCGRTEAQALLCAPGYCCHKKEVPADLYGDCRDVDTAMKSFYDICTLCYPVNVHFMTVLLGLQLTVLDLVYYNLKAEKCVFL